MLSRLGTALLALLLAVTGVGVCARGVQACAAGVAQGRDCCAEAGSLAASDCCCPARAERAAAFPSSDLNPATAIHLVATAAPLIAIPCFTADTLRPGMPPASRAQAPPDTPVALHISLLV